MVLHMTHVLGGGAMLMHVSLHRLHGTIVAGFGVAVRARVLSLREWRKCEDEGGQSK